MTFGTRKAASTCLMLNLSLALVTSQKEQSGGGGVVWSKSIINLHSGKIVKSFKIEDMFFRHRMFSSTFLSLLFRRSEFHSDVDQLRQGQHERSYSKEDRNLLCDAGIRAGRCRTCIGGIPITLHVGKSYACMIDKLILLFSKCF